MGRADKPLPEGTPRMQPFWDAARRDRLVLQECRRCDARYFPAVELCNDCLLADRLEWVGASGRGTIYTYVVMHQVTHPAFADEVPYLVVDVKLAEGPRMISRLVDCPPSQVCVGIDVEVTFVDGGDGTRLPAFRRAAT